MPLPLDNSGKVLPASELHYVKDGVFLILARDGNGHGRDAMLSKYKSMLHPPVPDVGLADVAVGVQT